MAYAILVKDPSIHSIYRIAADEDEKNSLNIFENDYRVIEISEADFTSLQQVTKRLSTSTADSITLEPISGDTEITESELKKVHTGIIKSINRFLKNNSNNPQYSFWNTYKSTLENFDYSTITFPLTKYWEQYCSDNSISHKSPLQIP